MLRLAAVGFRHGHNWSLVKGLLATGQAELVAVAEDHPPLAAQAAERLHVPVFDTLETMLASVRVDAASLAPVNCRKADAICTLAERGIHCFVDKPITTTLEGLDRIESSVRRAGVECIAALPLRFMGAYATARRLIRQGDVGRVVSVLALRSHNLHPERRQPWELTLQENGGPLVDLGSHDFDFVSWCLDARPVSVFGSQTLARYQDLATFVDAAQMCVRYADGATAYFAADWLTPDGTKVAATGMTLVGAQGTLRIVESGDELWRLGPGAGWERVPNDTGLADLHADFLAAARGEPHVVKTDECLAGVRVLLSGRRSAETGELVRLD
jgi:myo-inositol 2-dehydrogenase/D-chiro-inositol 1-dehydrogenase